MDELKKRLTYLMLFRVGLVTLLLVATAMQPIPDSSWSEIKQRLTKQR